MYSPRLRSAFLILAVAAIAVSVPVPLQAQEAGPTVDLPRVVLRGFPFEAIVRGVGPEASDSLGYALRVGERQDVLVFEEGVAVAEGLTAQERTVRVEVLRAGQVVGAGSVTSIPGWLSLVPALLAILAALLFRQVVAALFAGVWAGAWLAYGGTGGGFVQGLLDSVQVFVLEALTDPDHMSIILFSLLIGGMVGIISRNGGTQGIVNVVTRWARTPRRGQLATAVLGCVIFFDDYANTLIVGNTMRPVTDRLRISREKLAYLVDSTAAPVTTIALVTTWIGFQVGLIDEAVGNIQGYSESAYAIFLSSIPYSFYPILAIFFVFLIAWTGRDFGAMLKAERRARETGQLTRPGAHVAGIAGEANELEPKEGKPTRAVNALLPVLVLVFGTLTFVYTTGSEGLEAGASLREIIGNGDSYRALIWASLLAVVIAGLLSIVQRILSLTEVVDAWMAGMKAMLLAIVILTLAWSLAEVNKVLHTADFLAGTLGEALAPGLVPTLVFLLAAATAFATGSSWGVMGILMPLVVPLAWAVLVANGLSDDASHYYVLYASVSAVLAGAVWGDHCSPISDTTILSSMASSCDHIDHVRTQLPYALTVGALAILVGLLPAGYGWPSWILLVIAAVVLVGVAFGIGKPDEHADVERIP